MDTYVAWDNNWNQVYKGSSKQDFHASLPSSRNDFRAREYTKTGTRSILKQHLDVSFDGAVRSLVTHEAGFLADELDIFLKKDPFNSDMPTLKWYKGNATNSGGGLVASFYFRGDKLVIGGDNCETEIKRVIAEEPRLTLRRFFKSSDMAVIQTIEGCYLEGDEYKGMPYNPPFEIPLSELEHAVENLDIWRPEW